MRWKMKPHISIPILAWVTPNMFYLENPGTFAALAFLSGQSPDRAGRYVMEYFTFTAEKWEDCHDHIQWAFPSNVPSMFNIHAPIIDFKEFLNCTFVDWLPVNSNTEVIYDNLGELMEQYLRSIGIGLTTAGSVYVMDTDHPERLAWMINPNDHNHRRLTRLFMMWHHLQEPLRTYSSNPYVRNFEPIYHFIMASMMIKWGSVLTETLKYWERAFQTGKN